MTIRHQPVALCRAPTCRCGELLIAPALPPGGIDLDRWLEGLRKSFTDQALERAGGNKALAARLLGMHRTKLVMRLTAWAQKGVLFE